MLYSETSFIAPMELMRAVNSPPMLDDHVFNGLEYFARVRNTEFPASGVLFVLKNYVFGIQNINEPFAGGAPSLVVCGPLLCTSNPPLSPSLFNGIHAFFSMISLKS